MTPRSTSRPLISDDRIRQEIRERRAANLSCAAHELRRVLGGGSTDRLNQLLREERQRPADQLESVDPADGASDVRSSALRRQLDELDQAVTRAVNGVRAQERAAANALVAQVRQEAEERVCAAQDEAARAATEAEHMAAELDTAALEIESLRVQLVTAQAEVSAHQSENERVRACVSKLETSLAAADGEARENRQTISVLEGQSTVARAETARCVLELERMGAAHSTIREAYHALLASLQSKSHRGVTKRPTTPSRRSAR